MLVQQTGGHFVTERRIRQNRGLSGVGIHGHLPDGMLELDDQKPTAIELELSTKGWRRLQSIMADYAANLDIGRVWYFAGSKPLHDRLWLAAEGYSLIDVNLWSNDCPAGRNAIPRDAVNC